MAEDPRFASGFEPTINPQSGATPSPGDAGFDWSKLSPLLAKLGQQANPNQRQQLLQLLAMRNQMGGAGMQRSPWLGGMPQQGGGPVFGQMPYAMAPGAQ
jgi:hypothetical protein